MIGHGRRPRILVIDPEGELVTLLNEIIAGSGCEVVCAPSHGLCHDTFTFPNPFALAVMSITSRTRHFAKMIPVFRNFSPNAEFILLSRSADNDMWVEALANGAYDLFALPPDRGELSKAVFEALDRYENNTKSLGGINAA